MNRCLHITVHERPENLPRHPAMSHPGRTGSPSATDFSDDPRSDPIMARTDDPGSDPIMAKTDDPETDQLMPRTDDPGYGAFPHGGSGGRGAVAATSGSCPPACRCTAERGKSAPNPCSGPRHTSGFVIVRMAPGISNEYRTLWDLAYYHKPQLTGLLAVLELPVKARNKRRRTWHLLKPPQPPDGTLASRALVELLGTTGKPLPRSQNLCQIRELEKQTAVSDFPPLHSLTSYWRLDLRHHPNLVDEVVGRLNGLAAVGLAYEELAATDPEEVANGLVFSEDQGYLGDAPVGIGATWAWRSLAAATISTRPTICDLEQAWNLSHEDLTNQLVDVPLHGANRIDEGDSGHHGAAVLGELAAATRNARGIKGAAADYGHFVLASHYKSKNEVHPLAGTNGHVADAILRALSPAMPLLEPLVPLKAGDILLIEVQRGLLPVEVDEADFNAIRLAAAMGIIVIEAAGNGGFDLDAYSNPCTGRSLRRGSPRFDSGAILVGAARAGLPHDRAHFSNYGSRVDCFGWGEAVTTCGYGDLAGNDARDSYTDSFSGTSSASAMIAGAAALLQSLQGSHAGGRLVPQVMREILADPATGTRQGPNVPGHIGVMPDLKAILRDRLQLVPNVYLRRSIGDDGAAPATTDEISSSPDIFVSCLDPTNVRTRFGEGSGTENLAAPGDPVVPGGPIYLRLRNRGFGEGKINVQLFASPTATLLTPERWFPVSPPVPALGPVPQGDTLSVVGPIAWNTGFNHPLSAWSLLAILSEPSKCPPSDPAPYFDGTGGMPPGPPYFNWAEYRAFLRSPEVAWRNTHHAVCDSPLHFAIAGTPDRARHFDFEVIQHLPAGAIVTLTVPHALTAKLHRRLRWHRTNGSLELPKRPRTVIRGVELAAGAWIGASFELTVGGSALTSGHSLAIRQLWQGEEVGRITWFFGSA